MSELVIQIKQWMKRGDKQTAAKLLLQKKNIDKHILGQQNRKYHLEEVLMGIEDG